MEYIFVSLFANPFHFFNRNEHTNWDSSCTETTRSKGGNIRYVVDHAQVKLPLRRDIHWYTCALTSKPRAFSRIFRFLVYAQKNWIVICEINQPDGICVYFCVRIQSHESVGQSLYILLQRINCECDVSTVYIKSI